MDADQLGDTIWYLLALVLVASGLFARRLPAGKMLGMAAVWLGIIVALWALVTGTQHLMGR